MGGASIANITQGDVPALRARYYAPQTPQLGRTHTYALFVQDDVTIAARTSLNLGLLANRDDMTQHVDGSGGCPAVLLRGGSAVYESKGDTCAFLRFGFAQEIQPRVGLSYQLREGKGDKAYAHWGRYYNLDQKSSARSLAPRRIFQTQTVFDLAGNVLSTGPLASTTGKIIDPDIKPIYSDEVLAGYATPIAGGFSLDMFFMSRTMNNFIEDVPSRISGSAQDAGPYVGGESSMLQVCVMSERQREPHVSCLHGRPPPAIGQRMDERHQLHLEPFRGKFRSRLLNSGRFQYVIFYSGCPWHRMSRIRIAIGPLFEDRPHVLKIFSSYQVTPRVSAAGYLRVQSGTPWAARGRDWPGATLNYLEPAGSHRNPAWTNLDLMASYRLPVHMSASVTLEARLLNVFDNQEKLSTDAVQYLDLQTRPTPPYFNPYEQPNPFFGMGNAFAPPRRLHLAAVVTF